MGCPKKRKSYSSSLWLEVNASDNNSNIPETSGPGPFQLSSKGTKLLPVTSMTFGGRPLLESGVGDMVAGSNASDTPSVVAPETPIAPV